MTTNETLFFRDRHPFDALRDHVLPALIGNARRRPALRIWSAACSTGQEPYSLAMMLRESFPELANWRVEILATDIAPAILERAREGIYSAASKSSAVCPSSSWSNISTSRAIAGSSSRSCGAW